MKINFSISLPSRRQYVGDITGQLTVFNDDDRMVDEQTDRPTSNGVAGRLLHLLSILGRTHTHLLLTNQLLRLHFNSLAFECDRTSWSAIRGSVVSSTVIAEMPSCKEINECPFIFRNY